MKMKNTLAIIMAAALAAGTLAGCSQATLNYSKELSNTAKWEATTSSLDGDFNIDITGKDGKEVKKEIKFTGTGYTTGYKSYADITVTDPSHNINIPEIKVYSDGTTSYINKSFYEGLYKLTGQTVPAALTNMTQDYIGIDSTVTGVQIDKLKALAIQPDGMVQFSKLIFGENNNLDLPFVQNGREYTLNLDADKTVDLTANAIKAAGNNLDNLNNTFGLRLPAQSVTQIKGLVNSSDFSAKLPEIKAALTGTTISVKNVFADNEYNSELNMNLLIENIGTISLEMKSTATKSEVKAINFPTNALKVTQTEYIKMLTPENTVVAK